MSFVFPLSAVPSHCRRDRSDWRPSLSLRQCYATTHNGKTENSLRVNWMGFLLAFLTCVAAGCSPKSERASVEELYTTRMLGLAICSATSCPRLNPSSRSSSARARRSRSATRPRAHLPPSRPLRRGGETTAPCARAGPDEHRDRSRARQALLADRSSFRRACDARAAAPGHHRQCSRPVRAGRARCPTARQCVPAHTWTG